MPLNEGEGKTQTLALTLTHHISLTQANIKDGSWGTYTQHMLLNEGEGKTRILA